MANYRTINWDSLSEEERFDWAETIGLQQHDLETLANRIGSGANVSPKLLAENLRGLYDVGIPNEVLEYVADLLDGKGKSRGRPVESLEISAERAFDPVKADFDELCGKGITAEKAISKLARKYGASPDAISARVYPRTRKPRAKRKS